MGWLRLGRQPDRDAQPHGERAEVGDFDNDGLNDLVASDGGGLWILSHAGGPWTVTTVDGGPGSERLTGLIVADLTADGLDDIVVTGSPQAAPWQHAFAFRAGR